MLILPFQNTTLRYSEADEKHANTFSRLTFVFVEEEAITRYKKGLIKDSTQVHLDTLSDRSEWVTQYHSNHLIPQLRGF